MSITEDPWATTTTAAAEPASAPAEAPKVTVTNTPASGDKITLTFKGGGQFSDRWVVAHVASPTEGLALLNDPEFKELLDLSRKVGAYDASESGSAPSNYGGGGGNAQRRQSAPRAAQEAPPGTPPAPGPDWEYRTGKKKNGQGTWAAWMPPKGSNESPVWL